MNKMIQVRNLKPELHRRVRVRVSEEGTTITDWVAGLIERELERPSMKEVFARLRKREPIQLIPSAEEMVREDRDSR
jgi:antitoxin FitA